MIPLFLISYISLLIITVLMALRESSNPQYPLIFFSGIWCIVGFVANLGLYEYYFPSIEVNLMMLSGIVVFNLIYALLNNCRLPVFSCGNESKSAISLSPVNEYRISLIIVINSLCLLYILPTLASAMTYVLAGQFTALRSSIFNLEFTTTAQNALRSYIITPVFTATLILGIVGLFYRTKHAPLVLAMGIVGSLAVTLVEASRIMLVKTILITLITSAVLFRGEIKKLSKRAKLILFIVSISFIAFCVYITSDRSSDGDIVKVFFTYFFSGPAYLSQLLNAHNTQFVVLKDFLFGGATFGGFFNLILLALTFLGFPVKDTTYIVGSVLTSGNLPVSPTESINAMCTCYFDFIVDWGMAGVIIGPALLASVTFSLARYSVCKPSLKSVSLLIFWIYILIRTPFALDTINPAFTITILSIIAFVYCGSSPQPGNDFEMQKAGKLHNG